MLGIMKSLVVEEEGQALAEYGLLVALIAVLVAGGVTIFGEALLDFFTDLAADLGI